MRQATWSETARQRAEEREAGGVGPGSCPRLRGPGEARKREPEPPARAGRGDGTTPSGGETEAERGSQGRGRMCGERQSAETPAAATQRQPGERPWRRQRSRGQRAPADPKGDVGGNGPSQGEGPEVPVGPTLRRTESSRNERARAPETVARSAEGEGPGGKKPHECCWMKQTSRGKTGRKRRGPEKGRGCRRSRVVASPVCVDRFLLKRWRGEKDQERHLEDW